MSEPIELNRWRSNDGVVRINHTELKSRRAGQGTYEAEAALEPPTEVRLSWKVRRELQDEAALMGDSRESGGFLWGRMLPHVLGRTTVAEITGFSHNRPDDDRTLKSLLLSEAHVEEAFLGNPQAIGDWHTHITRGSFAPSDPDLSVWAARSQHVSWRAGRAPGYIGLIVGAEVGRSWLPGAMELRAFFVPPARWDVPPDEREPRPIAIREVG